MTMNVEQFAVANKATVDSLLAVANVALASAERIAALNLNAARSAIEDSASGAQAVLAAKSPQEAADIQVALAQPAVEKAVAYSRSVYEIAAQSQGELAKLMEAQFSGFQKALTELAKQTTQAIPVGGEGAFGGIQAAMNQVNASFSRMNEVSKQFAELTQANFSAATQAAEAMSKGLRK
ncbi:phasin family protein [Dechloromonas sp. ZY10]|uniref:phasin family protein n=1 Tax=Dechloromonas aquae TaxID=2664436 RepID=UPI003529C1A0